LQTSLSGNTTDGSRIFWTDLKTGHIYVRENDSSPEARTVAVSEGPAKYWTATPDGHYAFYTANEKLWRFDTENETREDLTGGAGAGVAAVIGASEDGEYVYFVAEGVLAGPNAESKQPVAGQPNLYFSHGSEITFIVTLRAGPKQDNEISPFEVNGFGEGAGDWQPGLGNRTAEVTPDGHGLVFMSTRSLTGYDNDVILAEEGKSPESRGLSEVFVYQAERGRLFCGSCNPSGEPARANVNVPNPLTAGFLPISHSDTYLPRWISNDGSRVFFDSTQQLVPQDQNGKQDVYEWERDGSGSCREAQGCVYLLSGGTSTTGSWLLDASETGDDVFIITRAQLTGSDHDEAYNVFDAHVGGSPPPSAPACSEGGCQGVPPAPPVFATPSSVTFGGVGNYAPGSHRSEEPKPKPLTKAQLLSKALKACHVKRNRRNRAVCEAQARRRYGAKKAKRAGHGRRAGS